MKIHVPRSLKSESVILAKATHILDYEKYCGVGEEQEWTDESVPWVMMRQLFAQKNQMVLAAKSAGLIPLG